MTRLALALLGPPRIELDGAPVSLDRQKAIALFAYLAVTGESHRRDALVDLLWPQLDSTRGRAALRRTLYALRQALGERWLAVEREEIGISPSAQPSTDSQLSLWIDVDEFQRHLADCESHGHRSTQTCSACVAPLTQAVGLVRGDFLSGFGLKDSFNFDDWQLVETERLRRELASALDRLVNWHSAQREFEPALAYARRRLALDPLHEPAHRQLMRLYAWSGQRSAALRQYEECVAVLDDQLGVPPQEATTELYRVIQGGRPPSPPTAPEVPPPDAGPGQKVEPPDRLVDLAATTAPVPEGPPFVLEGPERAEKTLCVARERELAQLDQFLDRVLSGQGRVGFVTGETGSGKTALVQELARRAQEAHSDLVVASGDCNAYTGIGDPYFPFREILELLTGDLEARWAAGAITKDHVLRLWHTCPLAAQALVEAGPDLIDTFVPRAALLERALACAPRSAGWLTRLDKLVEQKPIGPGKPGLQQSDLFEQYTKVLQAIARQRPLLLVVDDLQWADVGSIGLLFHLGRHLAGSRILIVGVYRAEEVAIGREGERHPLEPVVNEFQRTFGQLAVNLGQAESRDFLEAYLDSEPNRLGVAFREMLYRQTRGHPLFTVELLRGLQERGDLVKDPEGYWVDRPELDWETLPARVEAVIAERIGRLAQPLQALLRVASVEGEAFTAEVVAQVRGTGAREMLDYLSRELDRKHRLVRAQSIQRMDGQLLSSYRFRHILAQRYLYSSLDEVERVHLHEQVGTVLEGLYSGQERVAPSAATGTVAATGAVAVQLALHFQKARITGKAIHYLHQAAESAIRLCAYQEAIAHLTRGLALLEDLPDASEEQRLARAEQELALQVSLGIAWKRDIPDPEGEKALTRARDLCQQTGKTAQLCRVLGELSIFAYVRAEYQNARALAEEALSAGQEVGDPLLVAVSHWHLGYLLCGLGEFAAARTHLEQVLSFYRPQEHHHSFVFLRGSDAGVSAMAYDACCLWCLGFPDQALKRSQESLALARRLDHAFSSADVVSYSGCVLHWLLRDWAALLEHAEELMRVSQGMGFASFMGTATCYRGEALAMLGHIQEGAAQIRKGIAARESIDARVYLSGIMGALAEAQAEAGAPEEGLGTLAEALAFVEQTDERYCEAELHRIQGELLLSQGEDTEAEASFEKAIEVARRQSAKSWELRATTSLARLWQKQGKQDRARQVLAEIYGWFTEGFDTADLRQAQALLEELS